MGIRIKENETYESWASRVSMYEKGVAMQRIAQGESVEKVMDDMAKRISQKLMHPIVTAIKESAITPLNEKTNTGISVGQAPTNVADHVDGTTFDKSD